MAKFGYTVWFRDRSLMPDDQDYEWPACFVLEGASRAEALHWGDHLAKAYCGRNPDLEFLSSEIDGSLLDSDLPVISVGYPAIDQEIGW